MAMVRRKLSRRERRARERRLKKLQEKQKKRQLIAVKTKEEAEKVAKEMAKMPLKKREKKSKMLPSPTPTLPDAEKAKAKALENLARLKERLIELQHEVHHYSNPRRRNVGIDLIAKINKDIGHFEDLIEVYDDWIKRETALKKMAMETAKAVKKKRGKKNATK